MQLWRCQKASRVILHLQSELFVYSQDLQYTNTVYVSHRSHALKTLSEDSLRRILKKTSDFGWLYGPRRPYRLLNLCAQCCSTAKVAVAIAISSSSSSSAVENK